MTGLTVLDVNVRIAGVSMEEAGLIFIKRTDGGGCRQGCSLRLFLSDPI